MKTLSKVLLSLFVLLPGIFAFSQPTSPDSLLLSHFRPQSVFQTPITKIEKPRYPVIDMHAHVYAKTPEQVSEWVKCMDEAGLRKSIILTMAHGAEFDSIYALYAPYPDRFEVWCGFDYTGFDQPGFGPAAVAELERCVKVGAKGVGELGDKGLGLFYCDPAAEGMHSSDPRMDPLFEKCAELNLPINIHIAEPIWMYLPMDSTNDGLMNAFKWRIEKSPDKLDHAGMMEVLRQTLARHPNTTFIACHLANCAYDLKILGEMFDKYPRFYADISARFAENSQTPRATRAFFEKYKDRILYGTDMGTFDPAFYRATFRILESQDEHFYMPQYSSYHWPFNGLYLDDQTLEQIYRANASKIMLIRDGK